MSTEDETSTGPLPEPTVKQESTPNASASGNENFVVLDVAGDSEDSDREDKGSREMKEKQSKSSPSQASESGDKPAATEQVAKTSSSSSRLRKKPKAPVVDVISLRKRKWQLKVYPLHAEDLQLSYMSILCRLASESLLYIPSEGRHGKAELYVATQKETAAIIGKLLRMGFHHKLLSIEVVRKDTGGKEDGDESKKECKALLMFDKFLSKKIFDAKGEKGMLVEKIVTLHKLPKAATKDFVGALFPFATEIEIIDSDDPEERKATVKCKTPVTSLLVYKSFKRLEINDVHVKLSVDDSVKAISLPPVFFMPPPDNKSTVSGGGMGGPPSNASLNASSLPRRPPLMMNSLNRRAQMIKKRALLTQRKPTRAEMMRGGRPGRPDDGLMESPRQSLLGRPMMRRMGDNGRFPPGGLLNKPGPGMRDFPMGPGRRRMNERMGDRRNRDRDSRERKSRRDDGDSHVTKEMLQLQNQLNQAIKNQIAIMNTTQPNSGAPMRPDSYSMGGGGPPTPHRASLLGHGPRHFGTGAEMGGMGGGGPRTMDHQTRPEFGSGASWSDRGRMDSRGDSRAGRPDRPPRSGPAPRTVGSGDMGRPARQERPMDRSMDRGKRMDTGPSPSSRLSQSRSASERGRERSDRSDRGSDRVPERDRSSGSGGARRPAFGTGAVVGTSDSRSSKSESHRSSHAAEIHSSSRGRRPEFTSSGRSSQRNESSYSSSGSHTQSSSSHRYGEYSQQGEGAADSSYYRRY